MILVIGATGTNGSELIKQLSNLGERVRALVRDPVRATELKTYNVELVQGDLEKPATLDTALNGIDKAFIVSSVNQSYVKQISNFIEVAKQAKLKHIVKFSGMGAAANSPSIIMRQHAETDSLLKESRLAYTILQPNSFYQNLFWSVATIKPQGAFYLPLQDAKQSLVDVRDIAAIAAKVLTENGHEGETYVITGPQALTFKDVAAKLSTLLGKTITYVDVPVQAARDGLLNAGQPEWNANAIAEIYGLFATGKYAQVTDVVTKLLGREPISFDQFAQDYAAIFQ
ncbi:MAG: SDR family oxidoreductase [Acidobacteriota bacterium]